jgi:hypothetical protein
MSAPERVDELEGRVAHLEHIVQELLKDRARSVVAAGERAVARPIPSAATIAAHQIPLAPPSQPTPPAVARGIISEEWLGQRGFLAIGVVATLAALGYLLVLAFDRGWISPSVRCLGGGAVGLALAFTGWRLFHRGLTSYGATLIGAGIGVNYLAAWAATRLYGFLPTVGGTVTLAGLSALLAVIALLLDVEGLAMAAAVGGVLAPLILGADAGTGNLLLGYLAAMVLALGTVAFARRWRNTLRLLGLAGVVMVAPAAEANAGTLALTAYGVGVGLAGIRAGISAGWPELRLFGFLAGWFGILGGAGVTTVETAMALLAGGVLLSVPTILAGLRDEVVPHTPSWVPPPQPAIRPGDRLETAYFYLTAPLLVLATAVVLKHLAPGRGLPFLIPAAFYLALGLPRALPAFGVVGAVGLVMGGALEAPTPVWAFWVLLAQAVGWAASDHLLRRSMGRWFSLIPLVGACSILLGTLMLVPPAGDPAFVGVVAFATLGLIGVSVLMAMGLWRRVPEDPQGLPVNVPALFWALVGVLLLVGVTREINWYFQLAQLPERTRELAGGLLVSAWWAVFAGATVMMGFRVGVRQVRLAGLGVAVIAAVKVVLVDLSTLDALYRVGSVLTLAAVFLGVSYLYNRREGHLAAARPAAGH